MNNTLVAIKAVGCYRFTEHKANQETKKIITIDVTKI